MCVYVPIVRYTFDCAVLIHRYHYVARGLRVHVHIAHSVTFAIPLSLRVLLCLRLPRII